jgi:hypothetical protein
MKIGGEGRDGARYSLLDMRQSGIDDGRRAARRTPWMTTSSSLAA